MGAADRTTKLVARELRRRGVRLIEEVLRIELIVTNELKQRAVNFVRSGLARYVDLRAGLLAVFRAVCGRLDLELLNRIHRRAHGKQIDCQIASACFPTSWRSS